ncbi:MAG: 3'-5' exonuclease domain-containing protein 2 [Bacteroidales bacterium]|nr:3'-5' exonuclease domain-containing protein 2 [Candidatus Cryptobacteroides onthequi]
MYKISISPEEIEALPLSSFPGEIHVIDRQGFKFRKALDYLKNQEVIGFDTETRPNFSQTHHHYGVSLLQLSGPDHAYLFRIKSLRLYRRLFKVLGNEKIVKVGAAVNDDIRGLQRYHSFEPKNFVDLQKIAWEYGIKDKSVKKMGAIILGIKISKAQQLSNWEAEELSEAQQKYAATDAWICREMYLKLMNSKKNPLTPEQMMPVPHPQVKEEAAAANE